LPTKETNIRFPFSVCSKQTKICFFHFPFVENKRKLPFSVCGILDMETWKNGDIKQKTEAQVIFLYPFTICSSRKRKFVVYRLRNKRKLSVCKKTKRTKPTCPSTPLTPNIYKLMHYFCLYFGPFWHLLSSYFSL
jgi:hypothetical protein